MEKPITPAADQATTCCMPAISIVKQTIPSCNQSIKANPQQILVVASSEIQLSASLCP